MAFDIITMQLDILDSKSTSHNAVLTSLLRHGEEMDDLEKNGCFFNDAKEIERVRKEETKEGENQWLKVKDAKLKVQ